MLKNFVKVRQIVHLGQHVRLLHQSLPCLGTKGTEIKMPVLSPTMTEGKIVKWLKKEGETINPGDVICEIQTDKAVVAMEMEEEGILAKIIVQEDSKDIKIGELIALMVEEGENWQDVDVPASSSPSLSTKEENSETSFTTSQTTSNSSAVNPDRIWPSVRNLLHQYHIDVNAVQASGPKNTILKGDVLQYIEKKGLKPSNLSIQSNESSDKSDVSKPKTPSTSTSQTNTYIDIELSSMRRTIAKRLTESKTTIPHAYMGVECKVNNVIAYRKALKAKKINISVNDLIIKAAALALKKVPQLNAIYDGASNQPVLQNTVDISVAVATPNGLITPIIKNANRLTITEINSTVKSLADKAREGRLQPNEFIGGSFSISNLGMFGITEFSAVINPPQAAILAIGSPKTIVNDFDSINNWLTCTLSYDARVADEETVAEFLEIFRKQLESPEQLDLQTMDSNRRLSAFL